MRARTHGGASLFLRSGLGIAERPRERDLPRSGVDTVKRSAVSSGPVDGDSPVSCPVTGDPEVRSGAGRSDAALSLTGVVVPDGCDEPGGTSRWSSISIVTTRPWAGSVALRTRLAALVRPKSLTPTRGPSVSA